MTAADPYKSQVVCWPTIVCIEFLDLEIIDVKVLRYWSDLDQLFQPCNGRSIDDTRPGWFRRGSLYVIRRLYHCSALTFRCITGLRSWILDSRVVVCYILLSDCFARIYENRKLISGSYDMSCSLEIAGNRSIDIVTPLSSKLYDLIEICFRVIINIGLIAPKVARDCSFDGKMVRLVPFDLQVIYVENYWSWRGLSQDPRFANVPNLVACF